MHLTHLGHSCVLIEVADQRILIDPGAFSDVSDVADLTAVLVTHQHPDHLDPDAWGPLLDRSPEAEVWVESQTAESLAQHPAAVRVQRLVPGTDVTLGQVTLTPVGERHAVIHEYVPRIDNTGLVVRAPDSPTLFHPGDALDAEPGPVDVLFVPVNAPWGKIGETVSFVRRIDAARVVPIHDGLLNDTGRGMYLQHVASFGRDGGQEVLDLRGAGRTAL